MFKEPVAIPIFHVGETCGKTLETHDATTFIEEVHESPLLLDSSQKLGPSVIQAPNMATHNEDKELNLVDTKPSNFILGLEFSLGFAKLIPENLRA